VVADDFLDGVTLPGSAQFWMRQQFVRVADVRAD